MSTEDDTNTKGIAAHTVITDSKGLPVTVDNNPAHFDGLLSDIKNFVERTGKFASFLEQGMVFRGSKTYVDSAAAIPFVQGLVTGALVYTVDDPCPPTSARVTAHNAAMALAGSPGITPITRVPTAAADFLVNPYHINNEDLDLGNAIAGCFEDSDFAHRIRVAHGMGGRAMIAQLKDLASKAEPAEKTLVLRRCTRYAEAPVPIDLDAAIFEQWLDGYNKLNRRVPRDLRKQDGDLCEYLNVLFYGQLLDVGVANGQRFLPSLKAALGVSGLRKALPMQAFCLGTLLLLIHEIGDSGAQNGLGLQVGGEHDVPETLSHLKGV